MSLWRVSALAEKTSQALREHARHYAEFWKRLKKRDFLGSTHIIMAVFRVR